MTKSAATLAFVVLGGCSTPQYVDAIDSGQTRKIGSDDVAALPARITLSELFKRWGPAAGGKELIYVYRSKIDGVGLLVFVDFPDGHIDESKIGSAFVTKMIFVVDEKRFPITAWMRQDLPLK